MTSLDRILPLVVLCLLLAVAGCDNGSSSPVAPDQNTVSYSQIDLTVGTGAEATTGTTVTVQYIGWLYSETGTDHKGVQFSSGYIDEVTPRSWWNAVRVCWARFGWFAFSPKRPSTVRCSAMSHT